MIAEMYDDREMAPKRRRMLDMILSLGGLKEEAAIPLSRVNEEIASLKASISPIVESILSFPDAYFEDLLNAVQRTGLVNGISDRALIREAVLKLQRADEVSRLSGVSGLRALLASTLEAMAQGEGPSTSESRIDVTEVLQQLPALVQQIEATVSAYEENARSASEAALSDVKQMASSVAQMLSTLEGDPDEALESLQKIGNKTRYGPFLRVAAQLKRGKREGRIDEAEFKRLVTRNLLQELYRGMILLTLGSTGSKTVPQLASLIETTPKEIQSAIVSMIQRSEVEMVGLNGGAPVFAAVLATPPQTTMVVKGILQQLRGMVRSLEGESSNTVKVVLERLERVHGRLQLLSEYDETKLSEPVNRLRELVGSVTESLLKAKTSDKSEELRLLVSAGLEAFARFRLKIALEKGPHLVTGTNAYGEKLDPDVYKRIMDTYLDNEIERGIILLLIREHGAMSAKDLAEKSRIPQNRVLSHLLRMKRDELLTTVGETHGYVLYDVPRVPSESEVTLKVVSEIALQLAEAKSELSRILQDLKPQDIGRLANSLEVFSRARDKLARVRVGGSPVAEAILQEVEDKAKTAVAMAYRTRARIPSTRPKVTIDDLIDIDVPSVLDEYRDMMGYAPLLGFGTINWDQSKCLGCKSCELSCPEDAIFLRPKIDLEEIFRIPESSVQKLPTNRALLYNTLRGLAVSRPVGQIVLKKDSPGFGRVEVDLWLCVACRTCVRRCPGPENGALTLELKWSLPEVVRHMTAETR
ncbi:MAG: 4Fe-4S dicluster domain-containing protein [Candidatus Thorarchaeota archaeon]|nr:4Fe-4S dicluster domain-containing protein [Candidatus Thorarchaeota archaeon]